MITLDTIDSASHSIAIKDAAGNALAIDASGFITVKQGTSPWTVDGTVELGATTLAALENITVSGTVELGATTLAALENITATISGDVNVTQGTSPWVVSATDLDIRDISHVSDSIKIGDGTDFLAINADGSINAQFTESGYSSWSVSTATVGASEVQLASSPLSNRLRVEIQVGSKDLWVRHATGVSTSNGLRIPKGSSWDIALDAGASIYAISDGASADVRIAQYAA